MHKSYYLPSQLQYFFFFFERKPTVVFKAVIKTKKKKKIQRGKKLRKINAYLCPLCYNKNFHGNKFNRKLSMYYVPSERENRHQ